MTQSAPTSVVNGPRLTPPRTGLLALSDSLDLSQFVTPDQVNRFGAPFSFESDGCGGSGLYKACNNSGPFEYCRNGSIVEITPFIVYGSDTCSTWDRQHDFYGRATRRLFAGQSYMIENEAWTGSLGLNNPRFASPTATTVTGGPTDPATALAVIEDAIGDCMQGGRAMIHMRPFVLSRLVHCNHVRREGNVWLTPTDNIIVPGRGYPGSSPAGVAATASVEWVFATSMVAASVGEIHYTPERPGGVDQRTADNVKRSTNDVFVIAERSAAVVFDPNCCVLAAEIDRTVK